MAWNGVAGTFKKLSDWLDGGGTAPQFEPSGSLSFASDEFTRPTNTTGYALGDAVSNSDSATVPAELAAPSDAGYITKVTVQTDQATFAAPLRLHVFTEAPTAANDNAAFTTTYAEADTYLGAVDVPVGSAGVATNSEARLAFPSGLTSVQVLVEARGAFTPASGQKFTITAGFDTR